MARFRQSASCTHVSPQRPWSLPTPAEHPSRKRRHCQPAPRSSGTLASLARQSNNLLQSVITRMGKCSSFHSCGITSPQITTSHKVTRVYYARSVFISTCHGLDLPDKQAENKQSVSLAEKTSGAHSGKWCVGFSEEKDVRFGLVAVVRCQKHVVYICDEMCRKVTQAEESKVQFGRFP